MPPLFDLSFLMCDKEGSLNPESQPCGPMLSGGPRFDRTCGFPLGPLGKSWQVPAPDYRSVIEPVGSW